MSLKKLLIIILSLCIVFCMCSCGVDTVAITSEAENAVASLNKAFCIGDFNTAAKYVDMHQLEKKIKTLEPIYDTYYDFDLFAETWFSSVDINIISSEYIDENTVTVHANITALSMSSLYQKYIHELYSSLGNLKDMINGNQFSAKTFYDIIDGVLGEASATTTTAVDITLSNVNGTWELTLDDNLINALLGDHNKAIEVTTSAFEQAGMKDTEINAWFELVDEWANMFN